MKIDPRNKWRKAQIVKLDTSIYRELVVNLNTSSTPLNLSSWWVSEYNQQYFILRDYLFMSLYNLYRTRKAQFLCKPNWNRRAYLKRPIKLLFKIMRWIKKILTLESFIRFSFWNSSLLLKKKEILLCFLYVFGFCNQTKFLAPTLKILLVFLCETIANQLQQSKGCYRVSHILRYVQKS